VNTNLVYWKRAAIKKSVKTINSCVANKAMGNCDDIQADLEQLLEPQKIQELLLSAFCPKVDGVVSKLHVTNALIFCCMYTCLSQTSRRGEELYSQKLVQHTNVMLREIGPFGTKAAVLVTNKAKHNQVGWLEYTSMLLYRNPLWDAAAWHGCLFVWRLHISKESFPQFVGNPDYPSIFGIYLYVPAKDPKKHITPPKCGEIFNSFFADADAVCDKVVHQPRFQAIQELDSVGIHESEWT
jgi:hypothetical protein